VKKPTNERSEWKMEDATRTRMGAETKGSEQARTGMVHEGQSHEPKEDPGIAMDGCQGFDKDSLCRHCEVYGERRKIDRS
jgi:hypothetical protein